jgi:hypothetical protein
MHRYLCPALESLRQNLSVVSEYDANVLPHYDVFPEVKVAETTNGEPKPAVAQTAT